MKPKYIPIKKLPKIVIKKTKKIDIKLTKKKVNLEKILKM
jgi:hypothetical protein|tara:strand:- start:14900 stop:15019 length:120 start_codon:yes stop_codon:yes gene_type:complete